MNSKNVRNRAMIIGAISIATYIANYYLRHLLSVLTPQMLEFCWEQVGKYCTDVSSAYEP